MLQHEIMSLTEPGNERMMERRNENNMQINKTTMEKSVKYMKMK